MEPRAASPTRSSEKPRPDAIQPRTKRARPRPPPLSLQPLTSSTSSQQQDARPPTPPATVCSSHSHAFAPDTPPARWSPSASSTARVPLLSASSTRVAARSLHALGVDDEKVLHDPGVVAGLLGLPAYWARRVLCKVDELVDCIAEWAVRRFGGFDDGGGGADEESQQPAPRSLRIAGYADGDARRACAGKNNGSKKGLLFPLGSWASDFDEDFGEYDTDKSD